MSTLSGRVRPGTALCLALWLGADCGGDYDVDTPYARLVATPEAFSADLAEFEVFAETLELTAAEGSVFIDNISPFGPGLELSGDLETERLKEGEGLSVEILWEARGSGTVEGHITIDSDAADGGHLVVPITLEVTRTE